MFLHFMKDLSTRVKFPTDQYHYIKLLIRFYPPVRRYLHQLGHLLERLISVCGLICVLGKHGLACRWLFVTFCLVQSKVPKRQHKIVQF